MRPNWPTTTAVRYCSRIAPRARGDGLTGTGRPPPETVTREGGFFCLWVTPSTDRLGAGPEPPTPPPQYTAPPPRQVGSQPPTTTRPAPWSATPTRRPRHQTRHSLRSPPGRG